MNRASRAESRDTGEDEGVVEGPVGEANPPDAIDIGTRLKHARRVRGLSLKEVASSAGCSEGYLSKIENNKGAPSLTMLHRIVRVLGINLGSLFENADKPPDAVLRQGRRPVVDLDPLRRGDGLKLERIVPYSERHLLQCNIHIIEPGGGSDGQIQHEGEEVGYVLSGRIELHLDAETHVLSPGDAFYFPSVRLHGYRNIGDDEARILWVNTPPTF